MSSSEAARQLKAYRDGIVRRGGDPAVASFLQDYLTFSAAGFPSKRQRAEFRIIYDRTRNGNELNTLFRKTIGLGQQGLIPSIARPGVIPVFRGFDEMLRSGFVKVLPLEKYNIDRGYEKV